MPDHLKVEATPSISQHIEPTYIENEIQSLQKIMEAEMNKDPGKANVHKVLEQISKIFVLLARLSGRNDKIGIQDILPKLIENLEEQKKTYCGRMWMTYLSCTVQILGAGLGVGTLFAGSQAIQKGLSAASTSLGYLGQSVDKAKGVGDEADQRDRTILQFKSEELKRIRSDLDQSKQQSSQSIAEAQRALQQVISTLHEIASRVLQ